MSHYSSTLRHTLDQIWSEWGDFGYGPLATASGLCYSTVHRAFTRKTRFPQYRTVVLLAQAVGMDMKLTKHHLKVRKAG